MNLTELAARAAEDLRDTVRWAYADVRHQTLQYHRTALAQHLAEEETGVTFAQARLTSIYSYSQLTPEMVERSRRYSEALIRAYRTVGSEYADVLRFCDGITMRKAA